MRRKSAKQPAASLRAPPGYALQLIGELDVWGITTDEFDVPYLVKRPIVRE